MSGSRSEYIFLLLILAIASFLFLSNLGNQYLWQDEAQTALISKTVLTHGVPLGYDGKNYFSQCFGADYGKNYLWRLHPWFPFYAVAAVFKLFGVSTFTARLPFSIFGILTIFLTYYFSKSIFKRKAPAAIAATLLLFAVPFIILSRQCRYYSMAAFFSLLGLYSYHNLLENKRFASGLFFFSSTLLFHTNYVFAAPLLLSVLFHAFLFRREKFSRALFLSLAVVGLNLPWAVWFLKMRYSEPDVASFINGPGQFLEHSLFFGNCIVRYIFHPLLFAVSAFVLWYRRKEGAKAPPNDDIDWQGLYLLLFFIFFTIVLLALGTRGPFFRYLCQTIPVFYMIAALIVFGAMRVNLLIGTLAMAVLIFVNPLPDYLYEITRDYDGPIEGIVEFLKEYGKESDTAAITYGDLPVKFYTNMRVVGGLTGEDLSPAKDADWVILRKYGFADKGNEVREYLIENVPWDKYRGRRIDYPDILFENRETPWEHHYRTVKDEDRVVIYRRMSK